MDMQTLLKIIVPVLSATVAHESGIDLADKFVHFMKFYDESESAVFPAYLMFYFAQGIFSSLILNLFLGTKLNKYDAIGIILTSLRAIDSYYDYKGSILK